MSDTRDDNEEPPSHGSLLRAQNGDVIRFEPSGLTLRLSDRVVADLALRLGQTPDAPSPTPETLKDIDAWSLTRRGDWLHFTARLPGAQGTRGFRQHVSGGPILGESSGPLRIILGLGGARASLADPGGSPFPHHVLGPADDIGAVGMAGFSPAPATDEMEPLRECTHEAHVAQALLTWQMDQFRPLTLFAVRAETDTSASAAELAQGPAMQNLLQAAKNLRDAAHHMGQRAEISAVCLDFAWEHVTGDAAAYRDGMMAVMQAASDGLWALGFDAPRFFARFEAGLDLPHAAQVIEGQWELSWNHGAHDLTFSAPSSMFAYDRFDRPTADDRLEMAEMTAAAMTSDTWLCPRLLLAERESHETLRVTTRALGPLVLQHGIVPDFGFTLEAPDGPLPITEVTVAKDDPQALSLTCPALPAKGDVTLSYATTGPGGVHDGWSMKSQTGRTLHRYALPARLPVHGGSAR